MKQRVITGIPLLALAVVMIYDRGWLFHVVLTAFAFIAQIEIYRAMRQASFRPDIWPGLLFSLIICPLFVVKGLNGLVTVFAVLCALQIASSVLLPQRRFMDTMVSLFTLIYPCWFFIFLLLLGHVGEVQDIASGIDGLMLSRVGMVAAVLAPVLSDTGAYMVGRSLGRHKLSPNVSPNKTIEGAIGGLITAAAAMTVIGFFINRYYLPDLSIWHYTTLGVINGVLGQAGDLSASAIKRFAGIKDYGKIFPGHGGILDRLDSILFGAMGAYCYLSLFII